MLYFTCPIIRLMAHPDTAPLHLTFWKHLLTHTRDSLLLSDELSVTLNTLDANSRAVSDYTLFKITILASELLV